MIRIGLDVPAITRLGLRAQLMSRRVNRRFSKLRAAWFGRPAARNSQATNPAASSRPAPYLEYEVIQDRFEQLVDVLCYSAQHGVTVGDANRYHELRGWFLSNRDAIHPIVAPYVHQTGSAGSPVAAVLQPESLDEAINTEGILHRI